MLALQSALLHLQRVQQPARRRLADDPAHSTLPMQRERWTQQPLAVGYSSHEGAERADWGEDKLELVDATHPVVYPGSGSHANKYTEALYIGSSAEAGVGCDDTLDLTSSSDRTSRRSRATLARRRRRSRGSPSRVAGESFSRRSSTARQGPNLKKQRTEPIAWSEGWRDRSYAVPTGGVFGTDATDFFCSAVARGSTALIQLLRNPTVALLAPRCIDRARGLPRDPHLLAARGAASACATPDGWSDPLVRRPDVREACVALPRDRRAAHPAQRRHLRRPRALPRRVRAGRSRHDRRVRRLARAPGRRRRHRAHAARFRARPGRNGVRSRRGRRGAAHRRNAGIPACAPAVTTAPRRSSCGCRALGRALGDRDPRSRRDLACGELAAPRPGGRARGSHGAAEPPPKLRARMGSLASSRLHRGHGRTLGIRRRTVAGSAPDLRDRCAARRC